MTAFSRRPLLAALVVFAAAIVAATAYALAQPKRYEAPARVLVHPVPPGDRTFAGIDVIHDSFDSGRVLATAAEYFRQPDVIEAAARQLNVSAARLAGELDVHPIGGSNVLVVVVRDPAATGAAALANAVAQQAIAQRTSKFQAQVAAVLQRLRASDAPGARQRVVDLESLQGRPDPTLELVGPASVPKSPVGRHTWQYLGAGAAAGLVLAALVLLLTPVFTRLRASNEEREARELFLREQELGAVATTLSTRELELTERERAVAERELRVTRHERPFEAIGSDDDELLRRLEVVAERERSVARHAAELEERERELEETARSVSARDAAPSKVGGWSVERLETLVEEHASEHPSRVEEWRFYITFLRQHADTQGMLPASFDYLIEDTFKELL